MLLASDSLAHRPSQCLAVPQPAELPLPLALTYSMRATWKKDSATSTTSTTNSTNSLAAAYPAGAKVPYTGAAARVSGDASVTRGEHGAAHATRHDAARTSMHLHARHSDGPVRGPADNAHAVGVVREHQRCHREPVCDHRVQRVQRGCGEHQYLALRATQPHQLAVSAGGGGGNTPRCRVRRSGRGGVACSTQ